MGPRPDGRGNIAAGAITTSQLAGLQWGRDQMVAEISCRFLRAQGIMAASMGPRPDGRGNQLLLQATRLRGLRFNGAATRWSRKLRGERLPRTSFRWLQWGRDQMVAEIR